MQLASSQGALRPTRQVRTFKPRTRLDTSQVRDLRRTAPLPVASNPGGTRTRTEQSIKAGHKPAPVTSRGRRVGRNLTPGTPRRIGRRPLEFAGEATTRQMLPAKQKRYTSLEAQIKQSAKGLSTGGFLARTLTQSIPTLGAPVPIPLPARLALAAAGYFMGQIGPGTPRYVKRLGSPLKR